MTYFRWFEKTAFSLISSLCLISICCNGIVQSSKDDPVQLQDPKIVILGSTGVGKSSLANVLIGASPDCENCTFPICDGSDSCTKETSYAEANWLGEGDPFTVVDTPGFGDSDDEDNELIDEMVDALKNQINTTNVFLLSFNAEDDRMSSNTNQMLREMEALFGYSFWDNTVLEATHWAYDAKSVADRDYEGHNEEWWTNDKNEYLRKKFHLDHNLTAVFVDSYAKHGRNVEDEDQQNAFDRETAKLWELTNQLPSFPFKTLEDVLADLDECRRTIETDIADLQKEMEQVKENITSVDAAIANETKAREIAIEEEVTERTKENDRIYASIANETKQRETAIDEEVTERNEEIKRIDEAIANETKDRETAIEQESAKRNTEITRIDGELENEITNRKNEIDRVDDRISDEQTRAAGKEKEIRGWLDGNVTALRQDLGAEVTRLDEVIDNLQEFPIGTIIAWVPKPERDETGKPSVSSVIPDGWQRCDGTTINDGLWEGKLTPNLNGEHYFLRGGIDEEYLEVQDHAIAKHSHIYAESITSVYSDKGDGTIGKGSSFSVSSSSRTVDTDENETPVDETRPKNMKVVWLMKIA